MSLIELKDVHRVYATGRGSVRVNALSGVSLTAGEGEFVSIVGHSGSGGSTLMNILGCLDRPTSGEYILDGHVVSKLSSDQLADIRNRIIGFVSHSFNLLQRLDAVSTVEMPLTYAGVAPRESREAASGALEMGGSGGS